MLVRVALRRVYGQHLDATARHPKAPSECIGVGGHRLFVDHCGGGGKSPMAYVNLPGYILDTRKICPNLKGYYRGDLDSTERKREREREEAFRRKVLLHLPRF